MRFKNLLVAVNFLTFRSTVTDKIFGNFDEITSFSPFPLFQGCLLHFFFFSKTSGFLQCFAGGFLTSPISALK